MKLFVKNIVEDLVGDVKLSQCSPDCPLSLAWDRIDKLVISDYTRDKDILSLKPNSDETSMEKYFKILLTGTDASSAKKVYGLSKYLFERKKAGKIQVPGFELYVLPVVPEDQSSAICVYSKLQSAVPLNRSSTSSSTHQASKAQVNKKSNPLLSLLNTLEATSSNRSKSNIVQIQSKNSLMKDFEKQLRNKLVTLIADPDIPHVQLEPMEKPTRTLVHEIVGEYPELISFSQGEFPDRHVVVYRKGQEPADMQTQNISQIQSVQSVPMEPQSQPLKPKRKAVSIASPEELIAVHQVKRDRRTIEEIQVDISRKKANEIKARE